MALQVSDRAAAAAGGRCSRQRYRTMSAGNHRKPEDCTSNVGDVRGEGQGDGEGGGDEDGEEDGGEDGGEDGVRDNGADGGGEGLEGVKSGSWPSVASAGVGDGLHRGCWRKLKHDSKP